MRGHTETRWTDRAKAWAVVVALLCVPFAVAAFDSSALPGPSGGAAFTATGGTVTQPVVFTGDNSGGTGTVRIRPADEDTQVVLCEASNNASPEVCSVVQHYNQAATSGSLIFGSNIYLDSSSAYQRYNTSFGSGYIQTVSSSTLGNNGVWWGAYNTSGALASYNNTLATGASTATTLFGGTGTMTVDFRGPIVNTGSATCNSVNAGSLCFNDPLTIYGGTAAAYIFIQPTATNLSSGVSLMNAGGTGQAGFLYYGASAAIMADTVMASKVGSKFAVADTTDVAATSVFRQDVEDFDGTPIIHGGVYGDGGDYKVAVTPTALSGAVDNYAGCTKARCRLDPNGAHRDITGLTQGADGKVLTLCNIATGFNLVLKDSVTSTAANQFSLDADFTILPERCQEVVYDGTSSRWRLNN